MLGENILFLMIILKSFLLITSITSTNASILDDSLVARIWKFNHFVYFMLIDNETVKLPVILNA